MSDYTEIKEKNKQKIRSGRADDSGGRADYYPIYIQVEQTNRCNAECIMCNHFYLGNRGCGDLSEIVLKKLEPIYPFCETIMLNGDGEPFLCKSIENNMELFSNYGIKIGTNTNLCVVPDSVWIHFKNTFEFLNISCDGSTKETYEMIRRGLSFDTFLRNLSKLSEVAPTLKRNFDCVVMKQNISDLPGIVRMAREYGIKAVRFHRLGVNPIIDNKDDQAEYYYDLLQEKLFEAKKIGEDTGVLVSVPNYQRFDPQKPRPNHSDSVIEIEKRKQKIAGIAETMSLSRDYYSERVTHEDYEKDLWNAGKACQWALERCYVDIRGNVTTCCYNMRKNMGSLMEKSFDEIWNGEEYKEFRKLMSKGILPGFCSECNWIKESKF